MHSGHASSRDETEIDCLARLEQLLRDAIRASLTAGRPQLAVALDTARDFVASVLSDDERTRTRVAMARARAEIALESWRAQVSASH